MNKTSRGGRQFCCALDCLSKVGFGFGIVRIYPRITTRLVLLLLLATIRLAVCIVEQPLSSLMPRFPYFEWLATIVNMFWSWTTVTLWDPEIKKNRSIYSGCRDTEHCFLLYKYFAKFGVALLSHMGSFGHPYMKPTKTFGTAWRAYV